MKLLMLKGDADSVRNYH